MTEKSGSEAEKSHGSENIIKNLTNSISEMRRWAQKIVPEDRGVWFRYMMPNPRGKTCGHRS